MSRAASTISGWKLPFCLSRVKCCKCVTCGMDHVGSRDRYLVDLQL